MKAVVLAAGDGSRLAPLTTYIPKSMIPVGGKPVVRIILEKLKHAGIRNEDIIVVCLKKFFKSFEHELRDMDGIEIVGFDANKGTATHYFFADKSFDEQPAPYEGVLIHYGDIITDMNYREFIGQYNIHTLLLATTKNVRHDYSEIIEKYDLDIGERIFRFTEKPRLANPTWTGIMIANRRRILEYIAKDVGTIDNPKYQEFAVDIFPLIIRKEPGFVKTYEYNGEWYDLGNIRSYAKLWEKYITEDLVI
jgi:NDP-sugar pyrophosphorylase family protein